MFTAIPNINFVTKESPTSLPYTQGYDKTSRKTQKEKLQEQFNKRFCKNQTFLLLIDFFDMFTKVIKFYKFHCLIFKSTGIKDTLKAFEDFKNKEKSV